MSAAFRAFPRLLPPYLGITLPQNRSPSPHLRVLASTWGSWYSSASTPEPDVAATWVTIRKKVHAGNGLQIAGCTARCRDGMFVSSGGRNMLVLSRKVGERILVGDQIRITVVRLTNGGVRIGIEAPDEMPVLREEVKRQSDASSMAAVGGAPNAAPVRRRPR